MAQSFDINLHLGSQIAFTMPKDPTLSAYVPDVATLHTLDGEDLEYNGLYSYRIAPLLMVSAEPPPSENVVPDDFIMIPYTTSTFQTLYLTNKGNAVLTITEVIATFSPSIVPITNINDPLPPITLEIGETKSVSAAYYAYDPGVYNNYFIFKSNSVNGWFKIPTHQVVADTQDFRISPSNYTTSTNRIGRLQNNDYKIIPIFNGVESPNTPIPFTATISGSSAWTILSTGTNLVTVKFNSTTINNVNGTYTSKLSIVANGAIHTATSTATVLINYDYNKNLSSWLSPVSHDNSVIGVSYDLDINKRVMTIGVGTSSGALSVTSGDPHIYSSDLGLGKEYVDYPNWSKVYKIPFTGSAQVYNSRDYIVKTTTATDYSSYFGEFKSEGSMFVVTDDGYGNVLVELNNLILFNTSTVTTSTFKTLHNLTRAFHYYSDIDIDGRYTPLPTEYSSALSNDPTTTQLFIGFKYNTKTKTAVTSTSVVSKPS